MGEEILMKPNKIVIGHRSDIIANYGVGISFPVGDISFVEGAVNRDYMMLKYG